MTDEFNFDDITLIEIPVTLKGERYVLREATEEVAVKYRNAAIRCGRMRADGSVASIEGIASTEPLLVSLCLFKEGSPTPVGDAFVKGIPSRIITKLYEKVKEISQLDEGQGREALEKQRDMIDKRLSQLDQSKNSRSATTATSV